MAPIRYRVTAALVSAFALLPGAVTSLTLTVASSGGNHSAPAYGMLYEDGWHSGDGGLYAELIRNRAFQGSDNNNVPSSTRSTQFWHPIGGVSLAVDSSSPYLSAQLPWQMRMDVPAHLTGPIGFYNDGFWGMDVDATKNYSASMYVRGANYKGVVAAEFSSVTTGQTFSHVEVKLNQKANGAYKQVVWPQFFPNATAVDPNNTFSFIFEDGQQLAGKSVFVNLLSVFPKTYNNRANGLRTDMVEAVKNLHLDNVRLPGGNNLEGSTLANFWNWTRSIGPLTQRPGRLGTWSDVDTQGFGLLEQMQWTLDMGVECQLGLFAGYALDGETISQASYSSVVQSDLNELEFLLGSATSQYGKLRLQYGYPDPFTNIREVEIGNEDFFSPSTYYAYRFNNISTAMSAAYPQLEQISTTYPPPSGTWVSDLHYYSNEAFFASLFNAYDHQNRTLPIEIGEYGVQVPGSNGGEIGQSTISMAVGQALMHLGCERNADVCRGTSHGVFTKEYNENSNSLSLVKHTANAIVYDMAYYALQIFASNNGDQTLPVTASNGGYGPVYWSAQKNATNVILKLVNYNGLNGTTNAVSVAIQNSTATTATLLTMTAPDNTRGNALPQLGGEWSQLYRQTISGHAGVFNVSFMHPYEIKVLVV